MCDTFLEDTGRQFNRLFAVSDFLGAFLGQFFGPFLSLQYKHSSRSYICPFQERPFQELFLQIPNTYSTYYLISLQITHLEDTMQKKDLDMQVMEKRYKKYIERLNTKMAAAATAAAGDETAEVTVE